VQSFHWVTTQVTIFTVVAWMGSEKLSFAIVSDYLNHDKYATRIFLQKVLQCIKEKWHQVRQIEFFSDGGPQHFKQRFTLASMTCMAADFSLQLNWHFFATSHEKGAYDGIGGFLKHLMWQKIKARKFQIADAASFVEKAKSITDRIILICVAKQDIDESIADFDRRFQSVLALPNMHSLYCVRSSGTPYHCSISNWSDTPGVDFSFLEQIYVKPVALNKRIMGHNNKNSKVQVATQKMLTSYAVGNWVIVNYENNYFPGRSTMEVKSFVVLGVAQHISLVSRYEPRSL
jgi:hypothetical protein